MKDFEFYVMKRGWMEHPCFQESWTKKRVYCERQAWVWMIESAAFAEHQIKILGQPITLQRGQFCHALSFMATKFGWSVSKVRRFIDKLRKWSFCDTDTDTGQLRITICNYSKYQLGKNETDTATDTRATHDRHKEEGNIYINNNTTKGVQGEKRKSPPVAPAPVPEMPEWMPKKEFADYMKYRKDKRKEMTPRAVQLAIKHLGDLRAQGQNVAEIINQSIMNGWIGLFPLKNGDNNNATGNRKQTSQESLFGGFALASSYFEVSGDE